LNLPNTSENRR